MHAQPRQSLHVNSPRHLRPDETNAGQRESAGGRRRTSHARSAIVKHSERRRRKETTEEGSDAAAAAAANDDDDVDVGIEQIESIVLRERCSPHTNWCDDDGDELRVCRRREDDDDDDVTRHNNRPGDSVRQEVPLKFVRHTMRTFH